MVGNGNQLSMAEINDTEEWLTMVNHEKLWLIVIKNGL